MANDFLTSAATTCITPKTPVELFGYAAQKGEWNRIESDLEANVVMMHDVKGSIVIVGIDTLFASTSLRETVLNHLTPSTRQYLRDIIFVATHTHSAPALDATKPMLGLLDMQYHEFVSIQIAKTIELLAGKSGEQTLAKRGQSSCELNASRRSRGLHILKTAPYIKIGIHAIPNQDSNVPRLVDVVIGHDVHEEPIWVIWSWCCHAASVAEGDNVSADFPGEIRSALRSHFRREDLPVLFLPGFCGDILQDTAYWPCTLKSIIAHPFQRPFARNTQKNFKRLVNVLSKAICTAISSATPIRLLQKPKMVRRQVPLKQLLDSNPPGDLDIIAIDMGELKLLLISAEVCSPYLDIFRKCMQDGWILSGYTNHVFGYLPTDRQIGEGGYESLYSLKYFNHVGHFRSRIEQIIIRTVAEIESQLY